MSTTTHEEAVAQEYNETQAAIEAGLAMGAPHDVVPGEPYVFIVPKGASTETVRLPSAHPDHDDAPTRAVASYRPATVASLIEVVDRHQDSQIAERLREHFPSVFIGEPGV